MPVFMKRQYSLFLLTIVAIATFAQSSLPKALQVTEFHLSNGMTIWLNEDHSQPKVFGAVVVKAGAADSPNTGIAHYFEHIMFKGTDKIGTVDYAAERPWLDSISAQYDILASTSDAAQRTAIQRNINRLSQCAAEYAVPNDFSNLTTRYGGSDLNAATSYDYTYYYNTFSPQYIRQWAALNSERMLNPVFRLFQGELETVYEEKNRAADDMFSSAMEHVMDKAFEGTPYQYSIIGSTENLKNPQLSKMRDFYKKYYVASNMGLILAGDINPDSIVPLLESTFGRLPKGEPAPTPVCQQKPYGQQTYDIRVNIPVVSAELLAFQGPATSSEDAEVLTIAMQLLNNDNNTGMLDSLMNDSRLLAAIAFNNQMKRGGLVGIGIMPNILGKKSKAENLCREEIERLKRGDFSDEALALVKRNYEHNRIIAMEDIAKRAELMVSVFGNTDISWDEYVKRSQAIHDITREDILRVVRKYLGDNYLRFVKKYGSYEKDRLTQPGYTPIVPKHNGEESVFARELAAMSGQPEAPRFIDIQHSATVRQLAPLATLYTVPNPIDSIFSLQIIHRKGKLHDPLLGYAAEYLDELGTDSLSLTQLSRKMQQLGAMMSFEVNDDCFIISLLGRDSEFGKSVDLLAHFLTHAKHDEKKLNELKVGEKFTAKAFDKSATMVTEALADKLLTGSHSLYLNRLTAAEIKKLTSDDLLDAVANARRVQCSIVYSGVLPTDTVAATVCAKLHPEQSVEKYVYAYNPFEPVGENVVYVYQLKNARQNIVGTYQQLAADPEWSDVADRKLFTQYFGRGMSSVMFQEMREFRSLAYSVGAQSMGPEHSTHAADPTAFITTLGTQTDKTMQAVALLDSLLTDMPLRQKNVETASQSLYNDISNSYPSFRKIGLSVSNLRLDGYDHDYAADLYEALRPKKADDVKRYFEKKVRHAPRALFIIGQLSKSELAELTKYGRVVILKKSDLIRY